jgi:hypothetical protein
MTVFIYVNTSKQVGDADHLKVKRGRSRDTRRTIQRA